MAPILLRARLGPSVQQRQHHRAVLDDRGFVQGSIARVVRDVHLGPRLQQAGELLRPPGEDRVVDRRAVETPVAAACAKILIVAGQLDITKARQRDFVAG